MLIFSKLKFLKPDKIIGFSGTQVSFRKKITIGVVGQSNEVGSVLVAQSSLYPQAFKSLNKKTFAAPLRGIHQKSGGWWFKVFDDLFSGGYEMDLINYARGSASIIKHYAGQCTFRNNSTQYRQARASEGPGDYGDIGDITVQGGKVFQCTTGNKVYVTWDGNKRVPGGAATWLDYIEQVGTLTSAASDPGGWAAATLGSTITDGGIVWTCIDVTNSVGFANGQVFSELQAGLGFDPLGLLVRLFKELQSSQAEERMVAVSNAQSDTSATTAWYQAALQNIATYFTSRNIKVLLGLSCYNSANGSDRTTAYNALQAGLTAALAALGGDKNVYSGANLYALMGTTGNMSWTAAQAGTGWLNSDGVHLNAQGAIVAGGHWASYIQSAASK